MKHPLVLFYFLLVIISCNKGTIKKSESIEKVQSVETSRVEFSEVMHGVTISDPYQWLENEKQPETIKWIQSQNSYAEKVLSSYSDREKLLKRIDTLSNRDVVRPPVRHGTRYFQRIWLKDTRKSVYYWLNKPEGKKNLLFDVNKLKKYKNPSVDPFVPSWDGRYVAIGVREDLMDNATIEIFDVDQDVFINEEKISHIDYPSIAWKPDSSGFYYKWNPWSPETSYSDRQKHAEVRYHKLDTDPKDDATILPPLRDPRKSIGLTMADDGSYLIITITKGRGPNSIYVLDMLTPNSKPRILVREETHKYRVRSHNGRFFALTNQNAPLYKIIMAAQTNSELEDFSTIVDEDGAVLDYFWIFGDRLVLHYKKDTISMIRVHNLDGTLVHKIDLPTAGLAFNFVGNAEDEWFFFTFLSYNTPPVYLRCSVKTGKTVEWGRPASDVNPEEIAVKQVFYSSKDGTKIPLFVVHRKDLDMTKTHPVLMYGYGAFGISIYPAFNAAYISWIEKGGIVAEPGVRGGGEYGRAWHKAGILENKQNSVDDFISAAEWLIDKGYTQPGKIAAWGGSAGGVLLGAAMTQKPHLFSAITMINPRLDLVRYTKMKDSSLAVIGEYGDPAKPKQFRFLYSISPYHRIRKGVKYPALLIMSAYKDERVSSMHSRKFVARMQWAQANPNKPILLLTDMRSGHKGSGLIMKQITRDANMVAFLWNNTI